MKFTQKLTMSILLLLCTVLSLGGAWTIEQNLHNALRRAEQECTVVHQKERFEMETLLREQNVENMIQAAAAAEFYCSHIQSSIGAANTAFALIMGDGTSVYSYMPQSIRFIQQMEAIQIGTDGLLYENNRGRWHILLASPLQGQVENLWLVNAYDITDLYAERDRQLKQFFWLECIVMLLAGAAAWALARFLTRPLRELEAAAGEIAEGHYNQRVKPTGRDEIALVGYSFNAMADAVEQNMTALENEAQRQKRFVQALTHELKTPMTAMLGYSDLLRLGEQPPERRQQAANFIYHETARLEKLSRQMMRLFGLQQETVTLVPVKVSAVFGDVRRSLPQNFPAELEIQCDPSAVVLADRLLLADLLLNLVRNGANANPKDGKVLLCCKKCESGWELSVSDTGKGIAPADIEKLTEPFYMVDKSRARQNGGSGMGLCLCDAIAKLHHAQLKFDSTLGEGTTVRLVLQEESFHETET